MSSSVLILLVATISHHRACVPKGWFCIIQATKGTRASGTRFKQALAPVTPSLQLPSAQNLHVRASNATQRHGWATSHVNALHEAGGMHTGDMHAGDMHATNQYAGIDGGCTRVTLHHACRVRARHACNALESPAAWCPLAPCLTCLRTCFVRLGLVWQQPRRYHAAPHTWPHRIGRSGLQSCNHAGTHARTHANVRTRARARASTNRHSQRRT